MIRRFSHFNDMEEFPVCFLSCFVTTTNVTPLNGISDYITLTIRTFDNYKKTVFGSVTIAVSLEVSRLEVKAGSTRCTERCYHDQVNEQKHYDP
jgi:hypothetical protein